jgi:AAHS family benzoate transporter-like MFS transporter
VAGIALPSIMKEMGVTAQSAGFMVSSALFGMMFGAVFLSTVADRIGRRLAIVICLALFSVFTAAAGMSRDPYVFSAMRFLAGLGIGGVMPNVVAQMTEYSPKKIRSTMVTLMLAMRWAACSRPCSARACARPTAGNPCSWRPPCRSSSFPGS